MNASNDIVPKALLACISSARRSRGLIVRPLGVHLARMRRPLQLFLTCALTLAVLFVHSSWASVAPPAVRMGALYHYAPETGHNIGLEIKAFYDRHGGLAIFGLPLTEVIEEEGMQLQYFERARVELRPGQEITLARLGSMVSQGHTSRAFAPLAGPPDPERDFFPATGHTLGGAFRRYWRAHGALSIFGYPISEAFTEINAQNGNAYLVQYFERARFEYHPETAAVMLGLLGREYADAHLSSELLAPAQAVVRLGAASTKFTPDKPIARNITLAAQRLNGRVVAPGEVVSFLQSVGDISAASGFVEDDVIVGGRLAQGVGGGICWVSSALYRAAFHAGLEIVERHPHSRVIEQLNDVAGFDAAVFTPDKDLRWRNDTPYTIVIATEVDARAGRITATLWGVSDGREVAVSGPTVKNRHHPGPPIWQYDASLGDGKTRRIVGGRDGMDVAMGQIVTGADGQVIRHETFSSHYEPWDEFVLYGANVAPPPGASVTR
jgi:hypothetical protein